MTDHRQPGDRSKKGQMRAEMRARLARMSPNEGARASKALCTVLESLLGEGDRPVLSFAPIRRGDRVEEVDLSPLHGVLVRSGRLALPRLDWGNRAMSALRLPVGDALRADDLEVRFFGVPEPARGEAVALADLQAVLVPGLAFDCAGGRLGRGAGFYDRFLEASGAGGPTLIGVCFAAQVVDRVPTEAHDRLMDMVVTEGGVRGRADENR